MNANTNNQVIGTNIKDAKDLRMVLRIGKHNYALVAFGYNKRDILKVAKELEAKNLKTQTRKWPSTSDQRKYLNAGKYQYGVYVYQDEAIPETGVMRDPALLSR